MLSSEHRLKKRTAAGIALWLKVLYKFFERYLVTEGVHYCLLNTG